MRTILALALAGTACAGRAPEPAPTHATAPLAVEAAPKVAAPLAAPTPVPAPAPAPVDVATIPAGLFPDGARSVRFLVNAPLYAAPSTLAEKVGVIRKEARAGVRSAAPAGDGCDQRWIELAPRGWACEEMLAASPEEPSTARKVALTDPFDDDRPLVPGTYGTVRKRGGAVHAFESAADVRAGAGRLLVGTTSVRATGTLTVDGRRFWRTRQGLIETKSISRFSPSKFRGVALAPGDAMPAWVRGRSEPKEPVELRAEPRARARVTGALAPRTVVAILETSADDRYVRVGDAAWIARADLRIATLAAPPDGTGVDEKWFDIDLDHQVLVAYQGAQPVYATMVSTGKREHRTPTLITRIASKLERATMNSDADSDDVYSVADVPWTMYYDKSYALHTSYWHDGFGGPRSHGCINLSPHDARMLYHWSSPDVPPGWTAVYGDATTPGSLVRVRSSRDPEPSFRGYARDLVATN
jgi:hypothetical protein